MAITQGGSAKSIQKVSANGVVIANAGSTVRTFPMPNFPVMVPANTYVEDVWWRVTAGALAALISVFADVTGPNEITVVINSPVAQALTLQIGGRVVEYRPDGSVP